MDGEFSVCQFFPDESYEYVRRFVSAEEAAKAFLHYISSVGARMGTTVRVIITDGGDSINYEWEFGKGIVFPPPETGAVYVEYVNGEYVKQVPVEPDKK